MMLNFDDLSAYIPVESAPHTTDLTGFVSCHELATDAAAEALVNDALKPHRVTGIYGRGVSAFLWALWLRLRAIERDAAIEEEKADGEVPPNLCALALFAYESVNNSIRAIHTLHDSPYDKISMFCEFKPETARETLAALYCNVKNTNSPRYRYTMTVIMCTTEDEVEDAATIAKESLQIEPYAENSFIIALV